MRERVAHGPMEIERDRGLRRQPTRDRQDEPRQPQEQPHQAGTAAHAAAGSSHVKKLSRRDGACRAEPEIIGRRAGGFR